MFSEIFKATCTVVRLALPGPFLSTCMFMYYVKQSACRNTKLIICVKQTRVFSQIVIINTVRNSSLDPAVSGTVGVFLSHKSRIMMFVFQGQYVLSNLLLTVGNYIWEIDNSSWFMNKSVDMISSQREYIQWWSNITYALSWKGNYFFIFDSKIHNNKLINTSRFWTVTPVPAC